MVAPWQETAIKVVIEFKKSNSGVSRKIELTHKKEVVPPALYGRVSHEVWYKFMEEIEALAKYHPYVQRQDIGQCCWNLQGLFCFLCIGFGIMNPDGGNWSVWSRELNDCIAHHQNFFASGGCHLSHQSVHGSHWVQIDINPNVAVGYAVGLPPVDPKAAPGPAPGDASFTEPVKPHANVGEPSKVAAYMSEPSAPPPGTYYAPQPAGYGTAPPPPGYPPAAYPSPPPPGYPPTAPPGYPPQ